MKEYFLKCWKRSTSAYAVNKVLNFVCQIT